MGGTSIKRKERKNRVKAKRRQQNVKRLTKKPVLKNIDIEAIKETFNKESTTGKTPVEEQPAVEGKQKTEDHKVKKTQNIQSGAGSRNTGSDTENIKAQSEKLQESVSTSSSDEKKEKSEEKPEEGTVK
ncbi:MAG: hypothetical protein KFF73_02470 [Cyclobacteriaceae bacterium]|nr:hypothetical protein [Cyclobacteriaceae bacterium]